MSDQTILITGASRGIGAAIAKRLAIAGYDIWLNYHSNHEAAAQVKSEIEAQGQKCRLLPFNVGDETEVEAAIMPLLEQQPLYGFVHNAGITRDTLLPMMNRSEWDEVININLTAFFSIARHVAKHMIRQRHGRIIAISSLSGETGQAGQVNYSAAKAGLIGAVKALAREVAKRNILVNAVTPGLIDTEMIEDLPLEQMLALVPLQRLGKPDEVAGIVNFLMGPEASYITGQVIGVNGGLRI